VDQQVHLGSVSYTSTCQTSAAPTGDLQPRAQKLAKLLIQHVDSWSHRLMTPREAI
jgi:hypothetical protein